MPGVQEWKNHGVRAQAGVASRVPAYGAGEVPAPEGALLATFLDRSPKR
jgi:hypothetical protein